MLVFPVAKSLQTDIMPKGHKGAPSHPLVLSLGPRVSPSISNYLDHKHSGLEFHGLALLEAMTMTIIPITGQGHVASVPKALSHWISLPLPNPLASDAPL